MSSVSKVLLADLEALFVNNPDLARIHEYQSRFNPIRVMKMERNETKHSNIMGWLLDPSESHGFGDKFLRRFISQALKGFGGEVSSISVAESDLRDAEIFREKSNIDIFISSQRNGWGFVVENKYHSKQHSDQLRRYIEHARNQARDRSHEFKSVGIFLSLHDEVPDDDSYATISYSDVSDILKELLRSDGARIDPQVKQFLQDYLEIIMDASGMNQEQYELEVLAKQLYRAHKKALDFIMEFGASSAFSVACEMFGANLKSGDHFNNGHFIYNRGNQRNLSFIPADWKKLLDGNNLRRLNDGCEDWWSGYALTCRYELREAPDSTKGKVFLVFEIGPVSDKELRSKLVNFIESQKSLDGEKNISFKAGARREDAKLSRFLTGNSEEISDIGDVEAIRSKLESLTKRLTQTIDVVTRALAALEKNLE